ncbi:glutaredoxin [candidate division WOR-3 bacterium 4484_100]|uniref:Glutaredoxin n=1 Tax=candidate division WOR-3 bacterium 4484_100 TaxID=1936077 RepID=A0A1V4QF28_UNCW3|nr:MAG: glutaredoxin [candidate division WOR-3 bacterium 4484_100]
MPLLEEKVKQEVKDFFKDLKDPVKLVVFTQDSLLTIPGMECQTCRDNRVLMEDIAELSDKLSVEIYDFVKNKEVAQKYGVEKIPCTIVKGETDYGIRLYGLPGGYEFATLLNAIKIVSKKDSELSSETKEKLKEINKPIHIQVFVTLACPYCSNAAEMGHRFALENENISADMINAQEFPQLAQRYNVFAVPKIVVNETIQFEGALPENQFLQKVMEAV